MRLRMASAAAMVSAAITVGGLVGTSAASASADAPSGTLTIVVGGNGGLNYDPQTNALPSSFEFMMPVFDTLLNENAKGVISAGLATNWAFSNHNLTLTLTLRNGVQFQDGTPFNSAAVKANIVRGETNPDSVVSDELTAISSISTPTPTTVVLHLKSPAGSLLGYFSGPAGMMGSPKAFAGKNYDTHPVGTGPWEVSSTSVPGSDMIYTAFPGYWDKAIQKVATVKVVVDAESSFVPAMTGGSANAVLLTGSPTDGATLKSDGFPVHNSSMTFLYVMYFNKSGFFANPKVREAVSLAINRNAICTALLKGACKVTGQPVSPGSWAYDPSLPAPAFDPSEARNLLKQAGYPNGFSFTATVASTFGEGETQLSAIQQMLGQIGIKMKDSPLPIPDLFPALDTGKVQAYYGPDTGGADPAIPLEVDLGPAYNPGGYTDAALSSALTKANAATTSAARVADYRAASAEYQTSAYNVVVLNQTLQYATAKNVSGAVAHDPLVLDARGVTVGS
jgi:peptide/nickel transport system substrate-binding protein